MTIEASPVVQLISTVRATGNFVTAAAASTDIFSAPLLFQVSPVQSVALCKVLVWFMCSRFNAAADGIGSYQFLLDGATASPVYDAEGVDRQVVALHGMFTLAPGQHTVNVRVTAAVGNETTIDNARLTGLSMLGT